MTISPRRSGTLATAVLLAWTVSGCGSSQPIGPTPIVPTDTVILYSDTLAVGGRSFFSFVIEQRRGVHITLASTMADVAGPATPVPLALGLGTPGGTDCVLESPAATVTPALTAHIALELDPGTYCARVQDPGTMAGPLTFAVRIAIKVGVTGLPTPGSDLFATSLAVQGATSRSIEASQAGVVGLTLQGVGADGSQPLGIGIGIPRADGSGCFLTQSIFTPPGSTPQLTASVEAGRYCVRVFDPGTLANPVSFQLKIDFP
jgi:hypothetical protein